MISDKSSSRMPTNLIGLAVKCAQTLKVSETFRVSSHPIMLLILGAMLLNSCLPFTQKETISPLDILFPYQQIGDIASIDFREPSGVVFHPQRGTLFVIGDEGDIAEFQPDGALIKQGKVEEKDFEGITCDPSTGLLYIVTESKAKVVEIHPENFNAIREFTIAPTFEEKTMLAPEKNKVEAITFVSNSNHPQGGTFYLAKPDEELNPDGAASIIFEVEIPLKNDSVANPTGRIISYFPLKVPDLSGLHYDATSDNLYVISDQTNAFFEVKKDGAILTSYALPGDDQEGITVDSQGFLYIVQDSGGIIKFARQIDEEAL